MRLIQLNYNYLIIFLIIILTGCASANKGLLKTSEEESMEEAISALESVAGSYSKKELSEEELKKLAKDMKDNPETQSAVKSITDSMERKNLNIKYSPVTGKRYSGDLTYDPETGAELVPLEQ